MIGSLGAGLTLAIASSVALLLVSSVVAFRGWPGAPDEPSVDNVAQLTDSGVVAPHGARQASVATLQLPATTVVRRSRRSVSGRHRSAASSSTGTGAGQASATTTSTSVAPSTSAAAPATHESTVQHVLSSTGQHTSDTVQQTTDAAAKVIAPIAPPVGRTLEELGAAGSSAVQNVTTTAKTVLGG